MHREYDCQVDGSPLDRRDVLKVSTRLSSDGSLWFQTQTPQSEFSGPVVYLNTKQIREIHTALGAALGETAGAEDDPLWKDVR